METTTILKKISVIASVYITTLILNVSANADCKVVEYEDRNEVICEEKTKNQKKDKITTQIAQAENLNEQLKILNKINELYVNLKDNLDLLKSEQDKNKLYILVIANDRMISEIEHYINELKHITPETDKYNNKTIIHNFEQIRAMVSYEKTKIMNSYSKSIKPLVEVKNLDVFMTSPGILVATYSVKADFLNNDDIRHDITATVQALSMSGHVVETVKIYSTLDKKSSQTVAKEATVISDKTPIIFKWVIAEISSR